MSVEKAIIKTLEGKEITITQQTPIPCFRCGICCTCYQPPLAPEDIDSIASALGISRSKCVSRFAVKVPIKEGHLLKRTKKGCVFLAWDADGKGRCTVYPSRPKACREWTPSLAKPECLEGLARLKSQGQIMLLEELLSSSKDRQALCSSLEKEPPGSTLLTSSLITLIVGIQGGIEMGKSVKINITVPKEELKRVDAFARKQGNTRSGLIQRALDLFMKQKEGEEEERKRREEMMKTVAEIRELREKSGDWDGVSEIRKWRQSK